MIGIFGSGTGGLTVVKSIMERLAGYDVIYLGDTARAPFGNKSPEAIIEYAFQDMNFLLDKGAMIIVMASNTASGAAFDLAQTKFEIPLFDVVNPAVELALGFSRKMNIGVIGARGTVKSDIYEIKIKAVNAGARVYSVACPLLVPIVEEGWINKPETTTIIKKYLHPMKVRQIDTLILGCTHYSVLKNLIQRKIGKRVSIIDSSAEVAGKVELFLKGRPDIDCQLSKKGESRFYVSDLKYQFAETARFILKQNVSPEKVKIC